MRQQAVWAIFHRILGVSSRGNRLLLRLQRQYSAETLWQMPDQALADILSMYGVEKTEQFIYEKNKYTVEKVEAYLRGHQIQVLPFLDDAYPSSLHSLHQPPALLYCKGRLQRAALHLAMVGSRRADSYGLQVAQQLARELSQAGVCIVSGLARGIDGRAHTGALEGQGGTVAVLGCGIDQIYPREHKGLAQDILRHHDGAIVSEFPLGSSPEPWHFPQRNRIISGLSRGVILVQSPVKSGAFLTVEAALEQGRDVFAVPGSIENPLSEGPHRLLQEGARLVSCSSDILEEYGKATPCQQTLFPQESEKEGSGHMETPPAVLSQEEKLVLQCISAEPIGVEQLALLAKLPMSRLMPILSMLEIYGLVKQMIGRNYIRIG